MVDGTNGGVKLVCFDLGGVLVRICRSWREGCEAAGVPVRAGVEIDALQAKRRELADRYQAGRLSCEAYFDAVAATTAGRYTRSEVERIHRAWTRGVYDGIDELVARLEAEGRVELGVLSNTNAAHWRVLGAPGGGGDYGVLGRIRHLHASHLLGAVKPEPEVYRAFERATGFAGREVLFFDDLPENVRGARNVGWHAERIDHEGDTAGQIERWLREYGVTG